MSAVALTAATRFTAQDKMSAVVKRMQAATNTFTGKAQAGIARMNRAFAMAMRPLKNLRSALGSFGLFLGGALLVGALHGIIGTFADFEQANANLSSVMANATRPELQALQIDAKRLGAITAKTATEVVGLQEAFARLGFTAPEILNMTESTIAGSVAMRGELAATAELVGAMVRTFDQFSSADAPMIIDQLTASTQKSALNFEKLQTALPIVAGAANAAKIPFTKLLALLGKLSDSGIDASMSSTALRNIFLESAKQGLNYDQILSKIVKNENLLTRANDEFGKRAAVSAVVLAKNLELTTKLDQEISGSHLAATKAAAKQLDTLTGRTIILKSAWQGYILSLEDGTGAFSTQIKTIIEVATEVLAMAGGFSKATSELTDHETKIRTLAEKTTKWIKIIGKVVLGIIALKVALSVASAIITTYTVITKAITAAQWLWNAAMLANPIGLIIVAIVALTALIVIAIKKYNEWGAALLLLMGPLGAIINLIQSFRRNWQMIQDAFKNKGILHGLLAIGKVLMDSVLMPIQQLFKLIAKIPFLSKFANNVVAGIQNVREKIGVNVATDEKGQPINPDAEIERIRTERSEKIQQQNVRIMLETSKGTNARILENNGVPLIFGSTLGFGWNNQ